jgi:quercetin dioxygenase-like cupin family protein
MAVRRLLTAVLDFYREHPRENDEASAMLEAIRVELGPCVHQEPTVAPRAVSSASLLPDALTLVQSRRCQALAAAIHEAAPLFHWRQNPNYNAANMGTVFMAGYGYVEFAGPKDALFHAPDIRVGLLLLGPQLHYPPHAHPAEEIYHPLTDNGLWRRGQEDWRTVRAGHVIHHPPMLVHETKSAESTLLALYCWRGNTMTEAQLTN